MSGRHPWLRPAAARTPHVAVACLLATLWAPLAQPLAQPLAAQVPPGVTRQPGGVEFDFQDIELRIVLSALAEAAGLNAVITNVPSRTVTLRTSRPVSAADARAYLETLARTHGLMTEQEGGLLRISTGAGASGADTPQQPRSRDPVRLFVHRLNHGDAETLAQTLATLFGIGVGGAPGARAPTRSLSEELAALRPAPVDPSDPAGSRTPVAGEPAPDRGAAVGSGLTGPVQIVPDLRTNSLLIRSNGADYATLRAAIEQLDVRPVQVLIEVLIAEIRRDRQRGLGVSARVPAQRVGDGSATIGGELAGSSAGELVLRALQVGGVRADVVLSTLAADAVVSILSRPLIVTRNNQEARILVGSERPFVQLFRSLPTDAAVRDQVVQYRNVGTQLTIRPTINPDGYVSLAVLQEVSSATAETQFGAPVISTREARTDVLVKDGRTVVLGGLVDQQRERTASGVPILKDIPGLGWLFRSTQLRRNATELFLFLTPHVIRTDDDLEDATRRLQDRSGEMRRALDGGIPLLPPRDSVPPR